MDEFKCFSRCWHRDPEQAYFDSFQMVLALLWIVHIYHRESSCSSIRGLLASTKDEICNNGLNLIHSLTSRWHTSSACCWWHQERSFYEPAPIDTTSHVEAPNGLVCSPASFNASSSAWNAWNPKIDVGDSEWFANSPGSQLSMRELALVTMTSLLLFVVPHRCVLPTVSAITYYSQSQRIDQPGSMNGSS